MNIDGKLDKKNIEDILPLTPIQEGMLFHYLKNPEGDHYFEQLSLNMSGEIDPEIMKMAWDYVRETNEALRTVFRWDKLERPIQIILKNHDIPFEYHDLTRLENASKMVQISEIKRRNIREGINITKTPLRVALFKLHKNKYQLVISNHHIIYDGWSSGIVLSELFEVYKNIIQGTLSKKIDKPKFKEFIRWNQNIEVQRNYWKQYLKGIDTSTKLPIDYCGERMESSTGKFNFALDPNTVQKINSFCAKHKVAFASFIYMAWGILLKRYNYSDDIIFGTTVSGRNAKINNIEKMVGLFINTLPLRVNTEGDVGTVELLKRI